MNDHFNTLTWSSPSGPGVVMKASGVAPVTRRMKNSLALPARKRGNFRALIFDHHRGLRQRIQIPRAIARD